MYGLEAINANNGWAISAVGITIVFSGLVSLSLLISQLHKAVDLFENPQKIKAWFAGKPDAKVSESPVMVLREDQKEVVRQYALLARTMDDHFSLPRLLHLARVSGLKDPCAHLNLLLKSGIVTPDGEGYFCWDENQFNQTISY